jgi:hypothetical protein
VAQVGISIANGGQQIEHWLPVQLDPIADESLQVYLAELARKWHESLVGLAPLIAQHQAGQDVEYVFKTRYLGNTLRVWITPQLCSESGIRRLAEAVAPKDRWLCSEGVEAISYPPVPDARAEGHACALFS